jgi:hypothetical protein
MEDADTNWLLAQLACRPEAGVRAWELDLKRPPVLSVGPTFALQVAMTTLSPSKRPRTGEPTLVSRTYPLPGTQASGAIVFASLFILLGLGVGGFLGLHAYVHRSDPPASPSSLPTSLSNPPTSLSNLPTSLSNPPTSLSNPPTSIAQIPAGSTVLPLAMLPPQLRAESTAAPSAEAAPVASMQAVSTGASLRATGHAAVAAVPDKPAASEALSDNPYP